MTKPKWNFKSLEELHLTANATLKEAMFNERSKRWRKAAENYRRLFWLIDRVNLPGSYEAPASYPMLLYELHYHLGVVLQHIGEDKKAIHQYSRAIEIVSFPKNGCMAGCLTKSCLMTPIYCRRAFAHTRAGNMDHAIVDSERAVVLDSKNPDVYCIRALVKSSQDDDTLAICDLDEALLLNPQHAGAIVVRDALNRTLIEKLTCESDSYTDVTKFNHPHIMEFYDILLFTLCVPHTITNINLRPDKPSKQPLERNPPRSRIGLPSAQQYSHWSFRCGTPNAAVNNSASFRRRHDYSKAIRNRLNSSRPRSGSEFFEHLYSRKNTLHHDNKRREIQSYSAPSNITVRSIFVAATLPTDPIQINSATARLHSTRNTAIHARNLDNMTHPWTVKHRPRTLPLAQSKQLKWNTESEIALQTLGALPNTVFRRSITTNVDCPAWSESKQSNLDQTETTCSTYNNAVFRKPFTIETPTNYSIPVFQEVNIRDAPRMYYKPWNGDKLPVANVKRRSPSPAFY